MNFFEVDIVIKMPNSFDDLIKLSQQFETLEQCGKISKSEVRGHVNAHTPTPTQTKIRHRSILKNKAKSADAATIMRLRSSSHENYDIHINSLKESGAAKNVTFADESHLVEVRNFVSSSESLASCNFFKETRSCMPKSSFSLQNFKKPPELVICFKDPYLEPDFMEKFATRNVALDRCGARERMVTGVVLVRNIEYQKEVFVRYTLDKWKRSNDSDAVYIPKSSDGATDMFTFSILFPKCFQEMEFAVCYKVSRGEFWDSNDGKNFKVQNILFA